MDGDYKIGRTKLAVSKRINQWERKCQKALQLIGKFYTKNHEHCELMIHQELRANGNWVKAEVCKCKTKHEEFFTGTEKELIECITFWTEYFNSI